ncbi:MAG: translational GTPase TypA [Verrucomicrobiota bacterium]|nr:translational GTPase TypA [Verrucomicrobiota bacterium]
MKQHIRNIAIIAHVDHGKTTLVDCLLRQSGLFRENQVLEERMMDNMDLEREKGITIKAKNASYRYDDCHVNIVDTPGHADFGGEVERIMNMIDGVILVVDSVEGPQAQTRFVLKKALECGARSIVVINKIDRENAAPEAVLDKVFDLFLTLQASDEQLNFPVVYASAKEGIAMNSPKEKGTDMKPLFEAIVKHIPPPRIQQSDTFKLLIANLDYSDYLGRIAFGKIVSGSIKLGTKVYRIQGDGTQSTGKASAIFHFDGMKRIQVESATAGDIIGLTGFEHVEIGETITDSDEAEPLPFVPVDPPTICMQFAVNDGPFAGKDGKLVTARHIRERLIRETRTNISLRVNETDAPNIFDVTARGEMQISVLVEQMRREGYEVLVSRPEVIYHRSEDGKLQEPIEKLFLETPQENMGPVLESLANRKGDIQNMEHRADTILIEALIPMRGLIGFESDLVNITRGMGILSHLFHAYGEERGEILTRKTGSLISTENGESTAYALDQAQQRGKLLIGPGEKIYAGMVIGENARDQDLPVNPCRIKKLTNFRSSGDGKGIQLEPPMLLSLEKAIEFIGHDEYVEATPQHLRLRKKILCEHARKRAEQTRQVKVMS